MTSRKPPKPDGDRHPTEGVNQPSSTRRAFFQTSAIGGAAAAITMFPNLPGGEQMSTMNQPQDPQSFFDLGDIIPPFAGITTFLGMPFTRDVKQLNQADLVVMGVPFDNGTSNRPGTRYGPRVIREQSTYAAVFQPVYPWQDDLLKTQRIIDYGDVASFPGTGAIEFMLGATEVAATTIFDAGPRLLTIGGDHTLPYGPIRAASKRFGPLALIHLDSHQDSFDGDIGDGISFINHGTFATGLAKEGHIDLAKSSQVYIRTIMPETPGGGYNIVYSNDALAMGPEKLAKMVRDRIGAAPVYITLDIDALDPAFAPGTGSPVAGGPTSGEVRRFLKALDGLNVVAADLVEVNPLYDPTGATAVVAATLAVDLLYLMGHARRQ